MMDFELNIRTKNYFIFKDKVLTTIIKEITYNLTKKCSTHKTFLPQICSTSKTFYANFMQKTCRNVQHAEHFCSKSVQCAKQNFKCFFQQKRNKTPHNSKINRVMGNFV